MGYADGYYYGQGRIICDTSTFSVGDTIRVRSMTDSSKVWNQQVATVGTALVFTVPCYDYYKICTVQDIGGVATEVGGVYKTVDYGQTLFINVLDKTTLGGIQGILNAHQETELLAIGDEVTIVVGGENVIMQIAGIDLYNSHEAIFVSKHIWSQSANANDYRSSNLRTMMQTFYSSIDSRDQRYIKYTDRKVSKYGTIYNYSDYVFAVGKKEVDGSSTVVVADQIQFPLFTTQANRIKTKDSLADWWLAEGQGTSENYRVNSSGATTYTGSGSLLGVVPCFILTADS